MAKKMTMGSACGCDCGCGHHKVGPTMIVLFGLLFIAASYGWVSMAFRDMVWPWLVLVWGLTKLVGRMGWCNCGCMH